MRTEAKMVDEKELAKHFAGIIAENRTGNPKGIRVPECRKCKKWTKKTKTCSLYPECIPWDIFWGEKPCQGMQD